MGKYSEEQMEAALEACFNGMSLTSAAKQFGVPKTTLYHRLNGKHSGKVGSPNILPPEIEKRLVVMLNFFITFRIPLSINEFLDI